MNRRIFRTGFFLWMVGASLALLLSSVGGVRAEGGEVGSGTPLPHDCDGFTPGSTSCCMAGYVYLARGDRLHPEIVEGASVTLTAASGVTRTTQTALGGFNGDGAAYFTFNLEGAGIEAGEWVTLTTSYGGRQKERTYQVVSGAQQVDLVIPEETDFEPVTIVVDNLDGAASAEEPGFYIEGPVELLAEAECGAGAKFWAGTIYSGMTTLNGVGPATITASYRPPITVAGTYELFAYAPHGCVTATKRYQLHIPGQDVQEMTVSHIDASQSSGRWISLGRFYFPAGTSSYVQIQNVNGWLAPQAMGFDALKWELRSPFPALETTIVDNLPAAGTPYENGFYPNLVTWYQRTREEGCYYDESEMISTPIFWGDHIYWTYSRESDPEVNWAHWKTRLQETGIYDVEVFIPHCFAGARTARYKIYAGDQLLDEVVVDTSPQGGVWVTLGSYELPAGTPVSVYLDDVTGKKGVVMSFDAVRWVLRSQFAPIATINWVQPPVAIQGVDSVTLLGEGQDTDDQGAAPARYEWRSAEGTLLSIDSTLPLSTTTLPLGQNTVTFRVQDNEGLWSQPVTVTFAVVPPQIESSWHFMLYLAGDNNLSYDMLAAVRRLERISYLNNVTVTVLLDQGGAGGTWLYEIQPGGVYTDGVNRWYLGELNMGDPNTLSNYLTRVMTDVHADYTYLAIANHGRGIQGIAWDGDAGGDYLELPELSTALSQGTDGGRHKIDVLHLDACLMSMIEVGYELSPYADYMVASENLGWAFFGYDRYVQALSPYTQHPPDVAMQVAKIYHHALQRVPYTVSVMDLRAFPALTAKVDILAQALLDNLASERSALALALADVQRLDTQDYGKITPEDEFVDLRHLAELLAQLSSNEDVRQAAGDVASALALPATGVISPVLLYEAHSSWIDYDLSHANGLAIYFPPSPYGWDYSSYVTGDASAFTRDTLWDELLVAHVGPKSTPPSTPPSPPDPWRVYRVYLPVITR